MSILKTICNNIDTILTMVVAIAAVVTLYMQRKHNKLSVMPLLTVSHTKSNKEFKIVLKNCGLGTAVIKKVLYENGNNDKYDNLIDMLNKENRVSWRCNALHSGLVNYNSDIILNVGEEVEILSYEDDEIAGLEDVSQVFCDKDIKMKIKYESLYGEAKEMAILLNCR